MSSSILADTIIDVFGAQIGPRQASVLVRGFTELEQILRREQLSGNVDQIRTQNIMVGYAEGIEVYNANHETTIALYPDGNAAFGADLSSPDTTAFQIFAVETEYNGETFAAGSVLFGDNSTGKANLVWDPITGRVNFRGGASVAGYFDTDGHLYAQGAVIEGEITASSGEILGDLWVGTGTDRLLLDGENKILRSETYSAGVRGWQISHSLAEFGNARIRGELTSTVLKFNEVMASAGSTGVWPSAGSLHSDATIPATNGSWFWINVKNTTAGAPVFQAGDRLYFQTWDGTGNRVRWAFVRTGANEYIVNNGTYTTYGCQTVGAAAGAWTMRAGTAVVCYRVNSGAVIQTADGAFGAGPAILIVSWGTNPETTQTVQGKFGNLNGFLDYSSNVYGLAVGSSAAGKANLTADPTNGVRLRSGTTDMIVLDNSGNAYFAGVVTIGTSGELRQGTGTLGSNYTGLRMWRDTNIGRIGGYNNDVLQWYVGTDGRLYAGAGNVLLDATGVRISAPASINSLGAYKFYSGASLMGGLYAYDPGMWTIDVSLDGEAANVNKNMLSMVSARAKETYSAQAGLYAYSGPLAAAYVNVFCDSNAATPSKIEILGDTTLLGSSSLSVGGAFSAASISTAGDVWATADGRFGGGVVIGSTSIDPPDYTLVFSGSVSNAALSDQGRVYYNSANGLTLAGEGNSFDFAVMNKNGSGVMFVPTGTQILRVVGGIKCEVGLALWGGTPPASQHAAITNPSTVTATQVDDANEVAVTFNNFRAVIVGILDALREVQIIAS
jgi:hypothetical protein